MNGGKILVAILLCLCFGGVSVHAAGPAATLQGAELRDGTPVVLKLTEQVSSETHQAGRQVNLAVALDVTVDGRVVIAAGTPARGTVTWAESKGRVGRAGKLQIGVDSTTSVDGQRISLRSTVAHTGQDNETSSVALGIICCPLFLLMKGEEVVYPVGTEVKAYVEGMHIIK